RKMNVKEIGSLVRKMRKHQGFKQKEDFTWLQHLQSWLVFFLYRSSVLIEIASRFWETSRCIGLDPLAGPLKRLGHKKQVHGLPFVYAVQGNAEALPFAGRSVDLVVSNNGTNNVADIHKTFMECRRIMKPGGQLAIAVNTEQTMTEFYQLFEAVLLEQDLAESMAKIKDQIRRKRLSRKELESVLHACGFSVRQVIEDRFSMRFADGTTLFRHYLIRNFFLDGWKSLVPPDRQEKVFGRIEACLNETAGQKGHVSLTIPYMVLDGDPVF
ncbi:MAG: methyltransferase domain-containing protein, partial [Desulfobacteraceae bacterium]|nr:methyltransferase domain-containing protein [Desulfobacteraceae bacterium]